MPPSRLRLAPMLLALGGLAAAGCSPKDEIRSYTAARESTPAPPEVPEPPAGGDRSRLLGVIIPVTAESSRYIKFSGAVGPVSAAQPNFDAFVATVKFPDVNAMPTYAAPAGWTENPPRQFVPKSFTLPAPDAPQVTLSEPIQGSLLSNVNRWRKEVGLADVTEAGLAAVVTEVDLGGTKAYRVDFRGPAEPGSGPPRMRMPR